MAGGRWWTSFRGCLDRLFDGPAEGVALRDPPYAIHPTLDLAAVPEPGTLAVRGLTADTKVARFTVQVPRNQTPRYVAFDPERHRLVWGYPAAGFSVDIAPLEAQVPTRFALDVRAVTRVTVGEPLALPVAHVGADAASYELVRGPPGLRLEGAAIRWTPRAGAVGRHTVELTASAGDRRDTARLSVVVERPAVTLHSGRSHVDDEVLAVTPDGRRALVGSRSEPPGREDEPLGELTLVAVDPPAILARAPTPWRLPPVAAFVGDRIALRDGAGSCRLLDADLTDVGSFDLTHPAHATRLLPLNADAFLATSTFDSARVELGAPAAPWRKGSSERLDGGLLHRAGTLSDARSGALRQVVDPPDGLTPVAQIPTPSKGNEQLLARLRSWGRRTGDGRLEDLETNRTIAVLPAGAQWTLLRSLPAAVGVRSDAKQAVLEVRELMGGAVVASRVIGRPRFGATPRLVELDAGWVLVLDAGRLVPIDLSGLRSTLPAPRAVQVIDGPTRVAATETATLRFAATGGQGPVTFSLGHPAPGVTIDAASGVVTVDGAAAWRHLVRSMADPVAHDPDRAPDLERRIARGDDAARRTQFTETFGGSLAPDAFPAIVRVEVVAKGPGGERTRSIAFVGLAGPKAALTSALKPSTTNLLQAWIRRWWMLAAGLAVPLLSATLLFLVIRRLPRSEGSRPNRARPGSAQDAVVQARGGARCPFCHAEVESEEVACVACLARHHRSCWDEHRQCAACGAVERFAGHERTAGRDAPEGAAATTKARGPAPRAGQAPPTRAPRLRSDRGVVVVGGGGGGGRVRRALWAVAVVSTLSALAGPLLLRTALPTEAAWLAAARGSSQDPWGHDWEYASSARRQAWGNLGGAGQPTRSYGPDGRPGGGDDVEVAFVAGKPIYRVLGMFPVLLGMAALTAVWLALGPWLVAKPTLHRDDEWSRSLLSVGPPATTLALLLVLVGVFPPSLDGALQVCLVALALTLPGTLGLWALRRGLKPDRPTL